jgi:hypothetical protein
MESVSSNDSMMSDMSTTSSVTSDVVLSDPVVKASHKSVTPSDVVLSDTIKTSSVTSDVVLSDGVKASHKNVADSICTNNNNSLPHEISHEELELLKKLEEQNRSERYKRPCSFP